MIRSMVFVKRGPRNTQLSKSLIKFKLIWIESCTPAEIIDFQNVFDTVNHSILVGYGYTPGTEIGKINGTNYNRDKQIDAKKPS